MNKLVIKIGGNKYVSKVDTLGCCEGCVFSNDSRCEEVGHIMAKKFLNDPACHIGNEPIIWKELKK